MSENELKRVPVIDEKFPVVDQIESQPDDLEEIVDTEDVIDFHDLEEAGDADDNEEQEAAVAIAEKLQDDTKEAEIVRRTGLTPMRAIREKCRDCSCGSRKELVLCPANECPLWPYRKGRKPVHTARKPMSDEQKEAARQRFQKTHEARRAKLEAEKAANSPKSQVKQK